MKKTLLSVFVGITLCGVVQAQDLSEIYAQALAKDPVVNRAKAIRDTAFSGVTLSRSALLPKISGQIGYSISDSETALSATEVSSSDRNALSYSLGLSMSLYDHANYVGLDQAEKSAQQAEANYAATLQG